RGRPSRQELLRPQAGGVVPEVLKLFLEQAGTHRAEIDPQQFAQAAPLVGRHVLSTLEQQPPGFGEHRGATGGSQAAHLLSSDLVDGLVEEFGDVEAVEDVDGRRASLAYDVSERLPHVAGDEHDRLGTLFTQHVEEGVEGPDRAVTRHVQQTLASVVDLVDEREVLVPLFPGEFVYADGYDSVEVSVRHPPANGVLDAPEDGVPGRVEALGHLAPRQYLRPAREKPDERVGRLHLACRPRHRLHGDAATPAIYPAHRVDQEDREAP